MRTRFLNIDYFNCASNEALENLNFPSLPVPHLYSPSICNEEEICCFDSVLSISLEIETLPIENALSRFLSDVFPHSIDVGNEDFSVTWTRYGTADSDGRKDTEERRNSRSEIVDIRSPEKDAEDNRLEDQKTFRSEALEVEFPKKENISTVENDEDKLGVFQFETPELDSLLDHACFSEKEEREVLSEVPEIEIPLDMLQLGDIIEHLYKVTESIYSVDDMTSEYYMDQRRTFVEDAGSIEDKTLLYPSRFPLMELNEIPLEYHTSPSMEDELHLLFENIGRLRSIQKDNLMADDNELLGSMHVDIIDYFMKHYPLEQRLESELPCFNLVLAMDFISLEDTTYISEDPEVHLETSDSVFFPVICPVHFREVQILDLDEFQCFEVFSSYQTLTEPETCDQTFREDTSSTTNSFESIVSHELALVDDTFKSLPIPIISEEEKVQSLYATVEEILAELKSNPPSASDGIYLDWHLLEDNISNHDICSSYWNILESIDTYDIDSILKSFNDGMVMADFVFCDDTPDCPNMSESKEIMNELTDATFMVSQPPIDSATCHLPVDDGQKNGSGEPLSEIKTEKVSMIFESMSQFSDLDFFLNPREATTMRNCKRPVQETSDTQAKFPVVSAGNLVSTCASAEVKLQQWDIKVHRVKLSNHLLDLVDNFKKSYLGIIENDIELQKKLYLRSDVNNFDLLSLPTQTLMEWIVHKTGEQTTWAYRDETTMAFVMLYAIKQVVFYLCFYGIRAILLYVDNLYQNLKYMRFRLNSIHSLVKDAQQKAGDNIMELHPSLSVIQGILRSNTYQTGLKVLFVAHKVFWWPLKRLLTSMRKSYYEVQNIQRPTNRPDACNSNEFTTISMDVLLRSDCLLISHEHVSASFPFNKFDIILEYGDSYRSSRISAISPKIVGLPPLHFLKVEVEDYTVVKALCEGFGIHQNTDLTMERVYQSISTLHEGMKDQKIMELLNYVPMEDKSVDMGSPEAVDKVETCCEPMPVPSMLFATESKQVQSSNVTFPDIVIIVNTQNLDKEMLISRRSTYQKILALEKRGAQVVEREINMPVDLIFSAAMCLAWYDCGNIGKKATDTDEASICVPLCVENIATNILTSLSFSFSICILVFEGESSFLAAIMESSDDLYAATASLGVDLQIFCSYSSALTDEIILGCIEYATKLTRTQYPKMPESESLAEFFLTRFPSVNPLSAHAILSSGGVLVEFLEWTYDHKIRAIGKYCVPDESIALLGALCRYGEQEESKSGMTECSSASSAPDSETGHCRIESERKRRKYTMSPHKFDMPMDDYLHSMPLNRSQDGSMMPFRLCDPHKSHISEVPDILDGIGKSILFSTEKLFVQKQGSDIHIVNDLDWDAIKSTEDVHDKFTGEVIDLNNSCLLNEDFSFIPNSLDFTKTAPKMGKGSMLGSSTTTKRSPFDTRNHPAFPSAAEIDSDSDIWSSLKDHSQSLEVDAHLTTDSNKDTLPPVCQEKFVEGAMRRSTRNSNGQSFQEKIIPPYGGMPLSDDIHSSRLQQGSPWTMEFLNRIKTKSRMHQQSFQCNNAATKNFSLSGNIEKNTKRKSPSTLDCFRYQSGSTPKKIIKQKLQKRFIQSSNSSKKAKSLSAVLPTWTPIDRRARQTLSFARSGNETQSKLVWSDENVHGVKKRCRNQA